ncbi:hypothetical protein ACOMHN_000413 [Nucella lapillus]
MATETVRFPEIQTKPVYDGKFRDYTPTIKPAGKLTFIGGDTVEGCLKPKRERPDSPDIIRRFRRTFRPDPGKKTIFYGKAYDPHQALAEEMRHGVNIQPSISAGKLVNPFPKSLYQQKKSEMKERHYASHIRAPLGAIHDQTPGLPANLDPKTHTFGIHTEFDEGGGILINPKKTYSQVDDESAVGHDHYVTSHKDYYPKERVDRQYTQQFSPHNRFGVPTYCDYTGKLARKSLRWPCEREKEVATNIVSKRADDFRERFQPKVGKFLDPIKDTMRVGPDHTHGMPVKQDGYGVRELVHYRLPRTYPQSRNLQKGLIAAMRQHLKELKYHSFPDLVHAFRFYDKEGKGKIEKDDVREACIGFGVPVDVWLLEQVLDYCDEERDGQIDYEQFAKFLDWKESLPEGFAFVPFDMKEALKDRKWLPIQKQEEGLVSADGYSQHIQKQIDRTLSDHHPTSEDIHATAGPMGMDTSHFKTYGIPTIRTDIAPPKIRLMTDTQNYGDESNAYGLTNPSVYNAHGVYERHLLIPRSKEELRDIFSNVGVEMNEDTMDAVYSRVSAEHPQGHVSVETFRHALDDIQCGQIRAGNHPLAF